MQNVELTEEFISNAIDYCQSINGDAYSSNYAYDQEHYVNAGRFFMYVDQTVMEEPVEEVSDSFLSNFTDIRIRAITRESRQQYPHAFSCLFETEIGKAKGVYKHIDQNASDGWKHLRINIMLQAGDDGGHPIIGNKMYEVKTGEAWSLWAGTDTHSATPVKGKTLRVLLSLGYHVHPEDVTQCKRVLSNIVDYNT